MTRSGSRRGIVPVAVNHRGRRVPVWLGFPLAGALLGWPVLVAVTAVAAGGSVAGHVRFQLWVGAGAALVFLVGLYDDHRPSRTRGVVRQIAALFRGSVMPGVVKLGGIVVVSAVVAWLLGARGAGLVLAVPVLAGAANVWNLFDVAPGRCLKLFAAAAAALALAARGTEFIPVISIAGVVGVALLYLDLREMAMLGDAGANLLGFVVGVGLFVTLDTPGLGVALAVIVALHVLSETVTLSRAIRAVRPLRWLDGLGRVGEPRPERPEDP